MSRAEEAARECSEKIHGTPSCVSPIEGRPPSRVWEEMVRETADTMLPVIKKHIDAAVAEAEGERKKEHERAESWCRAVRKLALFAGMPKEEERTTRYLKPVYDCIEQLRQENERLRAEVDAYREYDAPL